MTDSRPSSGCLFVLDQSAGRIFSLNPDGSNSKTIVTGCRLPDSFAVDSAAGYIYWTNMGVPHRNDGSIERADLDGGNRRFIIPEGGTFTPKQLHLEKNSGRLYWSDREGMRVMRANLDGSQVETLIQAGQGEDDRRDPDRFNLLQSVSTFHLHPHLPHFEMLGDSPHKLDVLVEQFIDLEAPPHPFVRQGRKTFDALLQSKPNIFGGRLLICDGTIWTSTNGGLSSLRQFWANITRLG